MIWSVAAPSRTRKRFDSGRQVRLAADVPHPAEIAFSFFAHIGNEEQAIPEGVTKIGAFTRLRKGLDRFSQRQQRREAGAVVGNSRPAQIALAIERNIFFGAGREHRIEVRGDRNQRACRIGDERSQNVAGAVDAGMPAERPELSGHPFRALLLQESRRGNAAELQVNLVHPLFFAREPLKSLADAAAIRQISGGRARGHKMRRHFLSLVEPARERQVYAEKQGCAKMFSALVLSFLAGILILNVILLGRLRSQGASETRLRDDIARESSGLRQELTSHLQLFGGQTDRRGEALRADVTRRLIEMQRDQRSDLESIRTAVDQRLLALQADNGKRLEQMRQTVDEKLQSTLETRLGESFRLVSERLEQVHKGLGEMQNLASGVGDLKRVLSNVTTRGAWGEVQLENLLTQMLAPDQYERNISPTGSGERVEFAIRLPGAGAGPVWLPVDAKFPSEAYQRLAAAAERCDADAVEAHSRELETVVRACARTFSGKYLAPPHTTDFGILFLATEGLYAEILRRPGLAESLQHEHRVVLAGPTTFAALLNSLQMGFRTLAIQQRSGEVWKLLGDVKTQFGKYSQVLELIRKRLDQATQTVDEAAVRTRAIERRLKNVNEGDNTPEEDPVDDDSLIRENVIRIANAG